MRVQSRKVIRAVCSAKERLMKPFRAESRAEILGTTAWLTLLKTLAPLRRPLTLQGAKEKTALRKAEEGSPWELQSVTVQRHLKGSQSTEELLPILVSEF